MTGIDFKMKRGLIWLADNGKDIRKSIEDILVNTNEINNGTKDIIERVEALLMSLPGMLTSAVTTPITNRCDNIETTINTLGVDINNAVNATRDIEDAVKTAAAGTTTAVNNASAAIVSKLNELKPAT